MNNKSKKYDINEVHINGIIVTNPEFSHEVYGEKFYIIMVEVKRLSDIVDTLPVMISEHMLNLNENYIGQGVNIEGSYRSYNIDRHTLLYIFAVNIDIIDPTEVLNVNSIILSGTLCKKSLTRYTPVSKRCITDFIIAVNRRSGKYLKSSYIPCISWGRLALSMANNEVGTHISCTGRIQSRNYMKKTSDGTIIQKTAYEISIRKYHLTDSPVINE